MPHCQRCGKKFQDTARVLNHMNQPYSSCRTYYEEVVQIAEALSHHPQPSGAQSSRAYQPEDQPGMDQPMDQSSDSPPPEPPMVVEDATATIDSKLNTTPPPCASPFSAEFYPGASTIYDTGPTFMDNFDKDQYSKERRECLYYPFATKDEWQMASFLLRSGLSMAAMDQFFKLELVSDLTYRSVRD